MATRMMHEGGHSFQKEREEEAKRKEAEAKMLKAKQFAKKKSGPSIQTAQKSAQPATGGGMSAKQGISAMAGALQTTNNQTPGGIGDVAAGAGSGFSMGGPWGAVIGAGVGALQANQKTKAFNKELQANVFKEQGKIAVDTADKKNSAIKNIMDGFRLALLS